MSSIPLRAISSARPDPDTNLVPRTPHSARFDEADLGVPADTSDGTDSDGLSDSDPLLGNDNGVEEPPDSPLRLSAFNTLANGPIIALGAMAFLIFLIGVAYRKFEAEEEVYHHDADAGPSGHNLISYENYTVFPLTPKQYRAECRKMHNGEMKHMAYWTDMAMDVPHPPLTSGSDSEVCKSTVTYMLGSEVGLMGDLALLAQVAALADSVSPWMS